MIRVPTFAQAQKAEMQPKAASPVKRPPPKQTAPAPRPQPAAYVPPAPAYTPPLQTIQPPAPTYQPMAPAAPVQSGPPTQGKSSLGMLGLLGAIGCLGVGLLGGCAVTLALVLPSLFNGGVESVVGRTQQTAELAGKNPSQVHEYAMAYLSRRQYHALYWCYETASREYLDSLAEASGLGHAAEIFELQHEYIWEVRRGPNGTERVKTHIDTTTRDEELAADMSEAIAAMRALAGTPQHEISGDTATVYLVRAGQSRGLGTPTFQYHREDGVWRREMNTFERGHYATFCRDMLDANINGAVLGFE